MFLLLSIDSEVAKVESTPNFVVLVAKLFVNESSYIKFGNITTVEGPLCRYLLLLLVFFYHKLFTHQLKDGENY